MKISDMETYSTKEEIFELEPNRVANALAQLYRYVNTRNELIKHHSEGEQYSPNDVLLGAYKDKTALFVTAPKYDNGHSTDITLAELNLTNEDNSVKIEGKKSHILKAVLKIHEQDNLLVDPKHLLNHVGIENQLK